MGRRKYVSDYRLDKQLTESGKLKSTPIYQGEHFTYCQSPEAIRRLSWLVMLAVLAMVALLLPLLFNNTLIGHTIYTLLPMAFVLVPAFQVFMVGTRLFSLQQPLTREQRDLTDTRLRRGCIWLAAFEGVYCAGCGVYCFIPGLQPGEWPVIVCAGLGLCLSLVLLTQRKKAKTQAVKK